jgi:hypothetical protein
MKTLKEARDYGVVGTGNSKMPGTVFSISAFMCKTGSKLAPIKGTTCHGCYARRLEVFRPRVARAWTGNGLRSIIVIRDDPSKWVDSMVFQIEWYSRKTGVPYHRWFDSGDLQSVEMLDAIIEVCEKTPNVRHWLPTQERGILSKSKKMLPSNLTVRVSAVKVGGKPPTYHNTSTVHPKGTQHHGDECLAYTRGNNCGDCRACWDGDVKNISYKKH